MRQTKYWNVQNTINEEIRKHALEEAAEWIRKGETIAFPTETVYGLGANALSDTAISRIFVAKGRPSDNPLIVHIANQEQLQDVAKSIPPLAQKIIDAFWPGPITVIVPASSQLATKVTAGLDTVGVRMPSHSVALELIRLAGVPIAAPSANRSGKPSPTQADHVAHDLDGKIAGILDGGVTGVGVESTVVDTTGEHAVLLRPGGISKEQLVELLGGVDEDPALTKANETPKSPGMKYRHYAPSAPVYLVKGDKERLIDKVKAAQKEGKHVGVIATEEHASFFSGADALAVIGSRSQLSTIAHGLYTALRTMDEANVDLIYCETFTREGIGLAIMNRLMKAANGQVI
ncbi:threonylcarbamoyl-AMP synthase [Pullulanibacillus camelliae]|uniref:Threonylcarbamoyl-AMP synthase n=1 Tax=Pullulanibacillus camelliae TaxID=1707096 RepID=A0A8J2YA75_9BACL|nr:L-threonylcarbamoyladenylate synthase [Pullulanibacillus camelliae]GGE28521.1 threonylcarbamoyl-AMP synthase [Pullulanibacillus camelliae]